MEPRALPVDNNLIVVVWSMPDLWGVFVIAGVKIVLRTPKMLIFLNHEETAAVSFSYN